MRRPVAIAVIALSLAASAAPAFAATGWFGSTRGDDLSLFYGETPPAGEPANPETIAFALTCRKGSGVVRIFVPESSPNLKPGETVRLTLTAAGVATPATARVLPNELAGVPSLQASLPAGSASFNVLARMGRAGRGALSLSAGDGWSTRLPLRGLGLRADRFLRACGRRAR